MVTPVNNLRYGSENNIYEWNSKGNRIIEVFKYATQLLSESKEDGARYAVTLIDTFTIDDRVQVMWKSKDSTMKSYTVLIKAFKLVEATPFDKEKLLAEIKHVNWRKNKWAPIESISPLGL